MKLIGIALAAATLLGSVAVSAPAMADRIVERHTTVVHRDRKHWGNHQRHCRTVWRHHRRVTVCN